MWTKWCTMVHRPQGDYDGWAALGNPGWGYEHVLPYFRKSEDNRNPYLASDRRHHGVGGYLTVQVPPPCSPAGHLRSPPGSPL